MNMSKTPARVRDVVSALRRWAPERWAEEWDNPGWLVQREENADTDARVILSLDPVHPETARSAGCNLNVCHHPSPFRSLSRIDSDTLPVRLWGSGIDLFAAHTNLDVAPGGVNDALAALLGLENVRPLLPCTGARLVKFVTFVPANHLDAVREAAAAAGAGHIGLYSDCSYSHSGTGTFRPGPTTNAFTGTPVGELEKAPEERLEMVVPAHLSDDVVAAVREVHPYEEMAYDLAFLVNLDPTVGLGRIGNLPAPVTLSAFCELVHQQLECARISSAGPEREIDSVALVGGSAGEYHVAARNAGADVFLTGEASHHHGLEARDSGMALVTAGHLATERPVLSAIKSFIERRFPETPVQIANETDPWRDHNFAPD